MFKGSELKPVGPQHAIWKSHFLVPPTEFPKLECLDVGCRTVLVFSPEPLAGYWEETRFMPKSGAEAKTRGDVREDVGSLLAAQAAFALYFSVLSAWLQGFSSTEGAIASLRDLLTLLVRGLGPAEAPKKKAPKKRAGRSPR